MSKVHGNLIAEIKKSNLTQIEIAKKLNLSEHSLSMKIKGKTEFKSNEMFMIRDKFFPTKTIDELFER